MAKAINDGGPAFPGQRDVRNSDGDVTDITFDPGMSLRDYFAGQAIVGLVQRHDGDPVRDGSVAAYRAADAMIAARSEER